MYRALLLIGVGGVGKSTVADAMGGVLTASGRATAVVDTDMLAQFGPPPVGKGDFYDRLKCANLAAVWANFRAAGAHFLVVSAGIESTAVRARYADSLADCAVQVVRLVAGTDTVRRRLHGRDDGEKLDRHLAGLAQAEAFLDTARLEDFIVVNERRPDRVAREIIARAGWLDQHRT